MFRGRSFWATGQTTTRQVTTNQADRQATTNDQATAKDGQDTTNVARQQVTVITKLLQSMFSAVGA